jgi:hypothetical protein
MNFKLVQLLDCEGEQLALFAYNGNAYELQEVTEAIDKAYGDALAVLNEANGEQGFGPGDVEGDAEEALSKLGIYRVCAEEHNSEHF